MEKKTPLYEEHLKLGGKMVNFAGFLMPIQYPTGIIAEHLHVRNQVGMFDVSHMGEILIQGSKAGEFLDYLLSSRISTLKANQIKYGMLLNEAGGVIDDLLVYCISEKEYLLVVNASNLAKDLDWINLNNTFGVVVNDISEKTAVIAVQGPLSGVVLTELGFPLPHKKYTFTSFSDHAEYLISKTGYTGELGYEIYLGHKSAQKLWQNLLNLDVLPCGLGARDTLRLEAGLPLYGHELKADITPLEAGLSYFVDLEKADFIGKKALGVAPQKKLIGFKLEGRAIARDDMIINQGTNEVGVVTSGTFSPSLKQGIGMALIDSTLDTYDDLTVPIRNKLEKINIVKLPFVKKK